MNPDQWAELEEAHLASIGAQSRTGNLAQIHGQKIAELECAVLLLGWVVGALSMLCVFLLFTVVLR